MVRASRPLAALALALLTAGALAGCATGSASAPDLGGSTDPEESTDLEIDAAWLDGGRMIGLVTLGSSTCVPTAGEPSLSGTTLTVTLTDPPADTACTRDLAPRVTLVSLPEGVDPTQDLEIRVTGDGYDADTDLDGVAGGLAPVEDFTPSAGWTGEDGQFVFVTWGSSSCPPVISDAAATGPAEITVTFVEPPADQVCTADMAPRGGIASVTGLDDAAAVELVLAGDGFDGVRIPVVGSD